MAVVKRRKGVLHIRRTVLGHWTWELAQSNGKLIVAAPEAYSSKRNAAQAIERLRKLMGETFFTIRVQE